MKDSPSGPHLVDNQPLVSPLLVLDLQNYCTLNPDDEFVSTKDGNLETANSSGWQGIRSNTWNEIW